MVLVQTASQPVHPHACGEHCYCLRNHKQGDGSSPRLWGTHSGQTLCFIAQRFIPTPVGNTSQVRTRRKNRSVHPHACGEHAFSSSSGSMPSGSSPRLWGTLQSSGFNRISTRFIPTPVGNTLEYINSKRVETVHPHACGEHPPAGSN